MSSDTESAPLETVNYHSNAASILIIAVSVPLFILLLWLLSTLQYSDGLAAVWVAGAYVAVIVLLLASGAFAVDSTRFIIRNEGIKRRFLKRLQNDHEELKA